MAKKKNPYTGSSLEGLLRERGLYETAKTGAIKSVLAYKLKEAMKAESFTKSSMIL